MIPVSISLYVRPGRDQGSRRTVHFPRGPGRLATTRYGVRSGPVTQIDFSVKATYWRPSWAIATDGSPQAQVFGSKAGPAPTEVKTVPAGPATRRLARELGVDLGQVHGSAPGGRVTQEDIKAFVRQLAIAPAGRGASEAATTASIVARGVKGGDGSSR